MLLLLALTIIGAILCGGGLTAGFFAGIAVERSRKPIPPELPNPNKCGCGHHKSFHDKGTGRCRHETTYAWVCECKTFISDYPNDDPFLEAAKKELGLG